MAKSCNNFKGWEIMNRQGPLGQSFRILEATKDGQTLKSSSLKRLKLKINASLIAGEFTNQPTNFI